MTRTLPCRRMIRQCSQIRRTDDLTFMGPTLLLLAVDDPPLREVVGAHFDGDPVAREDADEVHPHLARDVGQDTVAVLELDEEHGVGAGLHHLRLETEGFFLRHGQALVRTRGPSFVTAIESSQWADSEPSSVTTVQPSSSVRTSGPPALSMGSIAMQSPSFRTTSRFIVAAST